MILRNKPKVTMRGSWAKSPKNHKALQGSTELQRMLVPLHFTNKENEVQRGKVTGSGSHSEVGVNLGLSQHWALSISPFSGPGL